jgi:hypothetical protein
MCVRSWCVGFSGRGGVSAKRVGIALAPGDFLTLLPTCKCMHYEVLDGGAVREMNIVDWLLLSLEAMTVCSSSQLMANPSKARDSGGGGVKRRKGTHA